MGKLVRRLALILSRLSQIPKRTQKHFNIFHFPKKFKELLEVLFKYFFEIQYFGNVSEHSFIL